MAKKSFKQLAIDHVEKGVFGLMALIVLAVLATTPWARFSEVTPDQINSTVKKNRESWLKGTWPDDQRELYAIAAEAAPANIIHDRVYKPISPAAFELSGKMMVDLYSTTEPLKDPELLALMSPIATSSRVLIQLKDDELEYDPEAADAMEQLYPGQANPNPDDDDVDDEFRVRQPSGSGLLGGPGMGPGGLVSGMPGATSSGMMSYSQLDTGPRSSRGSRSRQSSSGSGSPASGTSGSRPAVPRGPGSGSVPLGPGGILAEDQALEMEIKAQGYHFVSVRAVFPIRDQIMKYATAVNRPYAMAAREFGINDFVLERQTAIPGEDPWSGPWQSVNIQDAIDVLDNSYDFDAEVVNSMITDSVITMPLPMRLSGEWNTLARHPQIEKFKLSSEEIELETRLQHKILSDARDQQKQISAFNRPRGGFAAKTLDSRGLMSDMYGGGSMYGGDFGGLGSGGMESSMPGRQGSGSGMSSTMRPRGGSGMSSPGMIGSGMSSTGRGGRNAVAANPVDKLIQDMVKGSTNKDEEEKRIRTWIENRARAEGELLLFRYFDFSVEPGKTYRYRVKLVLRNPNYGKPAAMAGGIPHVVEGENRDTPWSEITQPVTVQDDVRYFAADVRDENSRALPFARFDVYEWSTAIGTYVNSLLNVRLGQVISDEVETTVIDPAKETFETKRFQFSSKDYLVDLVSELKLDAALHERATDGTSVKLPIGAAGKIPLPAVTLVAKPDDRLVYVNPTATRTVHAQFKSNMENQAKQFEYLKEPKNSLAGQYGGDEEGAFMSGANSGRRRNVLKLNSTSSMGGSRPAGSSSGSSGPRFGR